jgi:outer membrane protein insertion porin family
LSSGSPERTRGGLPRLRRAVGIAALAFVLLVPAFPLYGDAGESESRPVDAAFVGNTRKSGESLRRVAADELLRYQTQGRRPADIDDAAFRMEQAYRREGYAFARVRYEIPTPGGAAVVFRIDEGPRVYVDRVDIEGNHAVDRASILDLLRGEHSTLLYGDRFPFVRTEIESAVAALRDIYAERGYLDAVVDEPVYTFHADDSRADIALHIREGSPYRVRRLNVSGDAPPEARGRLELLEREMVDRPYTPRVNLAIRSRVAEIMGTFGYPDAVVTVQAATPEGPGPVDLAVAIARGPLVVVDSVRVEGAQRTRAGFIRDRLKLRPGDRYDLTLEKESYAELFKSGVFRRLEIGLEPTADPARRVLVVKVEEADRREIWVEPGYGSYEGPRGRAGYRQKNLLGTALSWSSEVTGSVKYQGVSSTLSDPFFLDYDLKADLTGFALHRVEPAFTRRDYGGSFFLTREMTRNLTLTGGYTLRSTDLSNLGAGVDQEEAQQNYDLSSIKIQTTYDTRNDLLYPATGQRTFAAVEQAESWLGGDVNFTRITLGARVFIPLPAATVLGLRYDTGLIIPGRENVTVPLPERFFNGGENTVRSFKEDRLGPRDASGKPAGGLGYNVISAELRHRLVENFTGSLFVDVGNVSPNRARLEQGEGEYRNRTQLVSDTLGDFFRNFRPGIGFGLQYQLPVGPARMDVGFNPDRHEKRDEDLYVVHFSLGMAF